MARAAGFFFCLFIAAKGDVLIHAGDFTGTGLPGEVDKFVTWLTAQPHKHKVVIAVRTSLKQRNVKIVSSSKGDKVDETAMMLLSVYFFLLSHTGRVS